ncbi:hypothetical protein TNCV_3192721 [Trichonephila clavipes]|nr:hypothetical protein TNCV_3192721 [Trichonephila clavipes]
MFATIFGELTTMLLENYWRNLIISRYETLDEVAYHYFLSKQLRSLIVYSTFNLAGSGLDKCSIDLGPTFDLSTPTLLGQFPELRLLF